MSNASKKPELRVMLWTVPRSLATALTKCMSFVNGVQIIKEPFVIASTFGPEAELAGSGIIDDVNKTLDTENEDGPPLPDLQDSLVFDEYTCTFDWVKETLEAEYPEKQFVFCHDQAFSITGKYDKIPDNYQHTFLIRHPHKVFPSWEKMMAKLLPMPFLGEEAAADGYAEIFEFTLPPKRGYGEMYELLIHFQESGKQVVVIDADELQRNPESVLRKYCEAVGIPFSKSMLQWEAGNDIVATWIASKRVLQQNQFRAGGVFDKAFTACEFGPPKAIPTREEAATHHLPLIDVSMPYYEKMYEMCIRA